MMPHHPAKQRLWASLSDLLVIIPTSLHSVRRHHIKDVIWLWYTKDVLFIYKVKQCVAPFDFQKVRTHATLLSA